MVMIVMILTKMTKMTIRITLAMLLMITDDGAGGPNDDNYNVDKNDLDLGKLELFRAMFCSQRRGGAVSHLDTSQLMRNTEKKTWVDYLHLPPPYNFDLQTKSLYFRF